MSINVFKFCSGLRILGYLMIVLVAAIVAVSYYAVVVVTVGPNLLCGGFRSVVSFAIAVVFHFLLVLLIWSYYMVVFRDPGSVPENWGGAMLDEESFAGSSSIASSDATTTPENRNSMISPADVVERRPAVGFCSRCQNSKPPRCHHCSVCQRCVLKMDHHCVWVVNCVGARNYKFFLLFLAYTFLETALDTLVLVPNFVKFFGSARRHSGSPGILAVTFLAFVLNLAFALSLLCFLVMHGSLLSTNTTTTELYEKKRGSVRWKYDLGRRRNFEQVFGTKKLYWFFPLFSKEDLESIPALRGLDFPTQPDT